MLDATATMHKARASAPFYSKNNPPNSNLALMQTEKTQYNLHYWIGLVMQTRRYGRTYVHSGARAAAQFSFRAFEHDGIVFSFTGWGRSLITGGHKYKVHARYSDSGKPVSSKILKTL